MVLSIVTLNYKKPHLTIKCLTSVYQQFSKEFADNTIEMVIVDNASGDDSVNILKQVIKKEHYKNVALIESQENGGFSKGCNLGVKEAKGEFILFLNNDTMVEDRGILGMADYLVTHPTTAILGGQLRNPDGSPQPSTGKFYNLLTVFFLLLGFQKFGLLDQNPQKITQVDWVKGGLLMIRKTIFEKLGGFDEKIFMYSEDMELCYRAKKDGQEVMFYPDVKVTHSEHGSASRSFAIINIYKGFSYFYKKHKSYVEYFLVKTMLITKAFFAIGIGTLTGNSYLVTTYKKAIQF